MKFTFYLRYHTKFGERLYITGNAAVLGEDKALIAMQYFNNDYWKLDVDIDVSQLHTNVLQYAYVFQDTSGELVQEAGPHRNVVVDNPYSAIKIYDYWNYAGNYANAFYTAPFKSILLPKRELHKSKFDRSVTHVFKVKAPLLKKEEVVCLLGNIGLLGNWNTGNPMLLKFDGADWVAELQLSETKFPIAYKFGIYNIKNNEFVQYEEGGNRICFGYAEQNELILLHDGFLNVPGNTWRGAGVAIPVFSLRSQSGLGIGEFNDLKLLADWASVTGLKLIQILPVNDTTATFTWRDSYPYAAISAFALHPVYINIEAVAGKRHAALVADLKAMRRQLNELSEVDYETVLKLKMAMLRQLFEADRDSFQKPDDYKDFFDKNKDWLKAYAAFCYLRDRYQSPDPAKWKTHTTYEQAEVDSFFQAGSEAFSNVQFYCYVQYHLHIQLKEAVAYAHKKGVVLKGDIPIGVYRYGCDTWVSPELYNMQLQAGAPPDDFSVKGQNWGFPTYNWPRMQQDGFAWWHSRFQQMNHYFDAFRIDHILGFFRIWSIPVNAVQGIMGAFDPCISVHINEFGEKGIWFDYERFCMPYITDEVLLEIFNEKAEYVKQHFLQKHGPLQYILLPRFDTQKKVAAFFEGNLNSENIALRNGLYDLISNVILFEKEGTGKTEFNFRIAIDQTFSFRNLLPHIREKIWGLYMDYFYYRQNDFWRKEALKKLPRLKAATNMLVCGEDLGMIPDAVPAVMKHLGILSLEIQRMPKQPGMEFFNPAHAPYLSVVTPSTHDMSTIRGWWQEDKDAIQRFYNKELGQAGDAPRFCEPWINRAIVLQHLYSPAMWSIFLLQDILGMSEKLRRKNPEDERINIPADPHHYWRYRMHLTLEELVKEKEFNKELKGYIENSGR